jgi:hypothetical protein
MRQHTSAYLSICQHTSYVSIRQHTSARYIWKSAVSPVPCRAQRQYLYCTSKASNLSTCECWKMRSISAPKGSVFVCTLAEDTDVNLPVCVSIRQHTSAYVSIRQHTSAYVSIRQHTSAYVSIRQHTSAYVSIRKQTSLGQQCHGTCVSHSHFFFIFRKFLHTALVA